MNKTVVTIIEVLLIVVYLGSVLFVLDSSSVFGLIQIGGASAVLFILIMVLEKRKDKEVGEDGMPIQQETKEDASQQLAQETQQQVAQQQSQQVPIQQQTSSEEYQQPLQTEVQPPPQQ